MAISVNIIGCDNGVGLSRDMRLLADACRRAGAEVTITALAVERDKLRKVRRFFKIAQIRMWWRRVSGAALPRFDINLMVETIRPEYFSWAATNAWMPNPEWASSRDVAASRRIDVILAKTRHAERLFAARGCRTRFVGFTSLDRNDPSVPRERAFFHLAGSSSSKGTDALYRLWCRHPEWPVLTIVRSRRAIPLGGDDAPVTAPNVELREGHVDDAELRHCQNRHRFHLCPSETEGYGHYIGEAMSVGAVVATLDAEPMNELVGPDRGLLVAPSGSGKKHLATTYYFGDAQMESAILRMLALDDAALDALGANARAWFRHNRERFQANISDWLAAQAEAAGTRPSTAP
ncbi:MAG: glycosyl transferase family 1 [Xanthomonadaceae bacterium]|nr:glycosyl transferase family 1 [Xanthomonadaceae bacterium]MDE1884937.1 glycosyl transferase family 1 [Xanthomonadaceae bacterium]MDE1960423.1 glycosyl transferase family 1 [Xanthomonadaceae bacterium]MDE2084811.1 glycosyl transferase family 1 [Xanthomonadaceae bacterium]MDE2256504.1 glycosyl transferase family 1 [Xanthomonadaceae bacterium]